MIQYLIENYLQMIHLFYVVENRTKSANDVNNNLAKISTLALQQKMDFNPDRTKQAEEVIISRKLQISNYPSFFLNHNTVILTELLKTSWNSFGFQIGF